MRIREDNSIRGNIRTMQGQGSYIEIIVRFLYYGEMSFRPRRRGELGRTKMDSVHALRPGALAV